jgi:hypothetical protein
LAFLSVSHSLPPPLASSGVGVVGACFSYRCSWAVCVFRRDGKNSLSPAKQWVKKGCLISSSSLLPSLFLGFIYSSTGSPLKTRFLHIFFFDWFFACLFTCKLTLSPTDPFWFHSRGLHNPTYVTNIHKSLHSKIEPMQELYRELLFSLYVSILRKEKKISVRRKK